MTMPELAAEPDGLDGVLFAAEDGNPEVSYVSAGSAGGQGVVIAMVVSGPTSAITAASIAGRAVRQLLGRLPGDHWAAARVLIEAEAERDDDAAAMTL